MSDLFIDARNTILDSAAPHAPVAAELVTAIRGGYNLPWGPEELKVNRRMRKIDGDRRHAAEFNALCAIYNVSQAAPRRETGAHTGPALECARNRVETMRAALAK